MPVTTHPFGTLRDGTAVTAYRLENTGGSVTILDYGATIQSLIMPDRNRHPVDVALGYDTPAEYERNGGYLGATIGRVGNRIGNAEFSLNGKTYRLVKNDGENHLHGGAGRNYLTFSRLSPNGEEHYPGNLQVKVTFTLTAENALHILYEAVCDQDTPVNLTNHTYFNLNGSGSVLHHRVQLFAERFCENDEGCLPTGRLLDVEGTPFDFRVPKELGADIGADDEQIRRGHGYDHNYVLSGRRAAVVFSAESGIEMTVDTDMPGIQLYSANSLEHRTGKGGAVYCPRDAVCLETQLFPNGLACYGFPSPILRKGQRLRSETVYRFRV